MKNNKPSGYWTKEKCREEALKYSSRGEFSAAPGGCYNKSRENNWLDEICKHMKPIGCSMDKVVYACEFPDKSVYLGITSDIDERNRKRKNSKTDAAQLYSKQTGMIAETKVLTELIPAEEASIKEGEFVEIYKNSGWQILNRIKTGCIGKGIAKWTPEHIIKTAKSCDTYGQFIRQNESAYVSSIRKGVRDEIKEYFEKKVLKELYTKYVGKELALD